MKKDITQRSCTLHENINYHLCIILMVVKIVIQTIIGNLALWKIYTNII